jgi:hypothetical protein
VIDVCDDTKIAYIFHVKMLRIVVFIFPKEYKSTSKNQKNHQLQKEALVNKLETKKGSNLYLLFFT